jgi:flagellar motor switch protein FliM
MNDPVPDTPGLEPEEVVALLGEHATVPTVATPPPDGLRRIAAQFAQRLATGLARCIGGPVRVEVAWTAVADPDDLASSLPDPICAFLLRPRGSADVDARAGHDGVAAVLALPPRLALGLAQRMLGGSVRLREEDDGTPDRLPSPGEWDVLTHAVTELGTEMADMLGYRPRVLGHETSPRLLADLPMPCSVCAFEVLGRGLIGLVHLLLPA